jgi:hypothetical protein
MPTPFLPKYSEEARVAIEDKLHALLTEAHTLGIQIESVHYENGDPVTAYSISANEIGRWAEIPKGRKEPEPLLIVNIDPDA